MIQSEAEKRQHHAYRAAEDPASSPGTRTAIRGRQAPLTPIQRDLHLYQAIHPGSTTFNIGVSVDMGDSVDPQRWEQAVRCVVTGDDITRSRIVSRGGEAVQVSDVDAPVHFEHANLSAPSEEATTARDFMSSKRCVPFELGAPPLLRNYLVKKRDGCFTAGVISPHILLDGLGFRAFFQRVAATYEARMAEWPPETAAYRGESAGSMRSGQTPRPCLIGIDGSVFGGRLRFAWTYARGVHARGTIERLADGFLGVLRDLIDASQSGQAAAATPSDFALAGLDEKDLANIAAALEKQG